GPPRAGRPPGARGAPRPRPRRAHRRQHALVGATATGNPRRRGLRRRGADLPLGDEGVRRIPGPGVRAAGVRGDDPARVRPGRGPRRQRGRGGWGGRETGGSERGAGRLRGPAVGGAATGVGTHAGRPSITSTPRVVGTTRSNRKPDAANRSRY